MNRRRLRWWLAAAGLLAAAAASWPVARKLSIAAGRPPNVLLITVDTLRRDHVSLYGYERQTTPRLDAFFADGTLFEHATSPSPCTVPAVRQVLSGVRDFSDARPHLAELLQQYGYDTGAVVSQHHFRTQRPIYERGFRHFDIQPNEKRDHHGLTTRTAAAVSNRAIRWLRDADERQPFFLWLHYFDPHDPYDAPPSHRVFAAPDPSMSGDVRRYTDQARERGQAKGAGLFEDFGSLFSPQQVETLRSLYDAEIRYVDAEIDRVLTKLRKLGLVEGTLVILTADHGEHLGEDGPAPGRDRAWRRAAQRVSVLALAARAGRALRCRLSDQRRQGLSGEARAAQPGRVPRGPRDLPVSAARRFTS